MLLFDTILLFKTFTFTSIVFKNTRCHSIMIIMMKMIIIIMQINVANVTYQNIKGATNIFKLHPCKLSIQL